MPKRSKKQGQDKKQDDQEGRPPNLTLASFIQFPDLPSASSSSTEKKNSKVAAEEKEETKTLGSTSQADVCPTLDNCASSTEPEFETAQNSNPIYIIGKTKKGKLPLTCESRAKGKKVTVISNVTGDAKALLSELKRRAGCGGVVRDEGTSIELQGDRIKFLSQFLTGHPCLKPYKG